MEVKGTYRHFKGNNYEVIGEAFEQSTGINYIFYRQLYSPFKFWVRPKEMFFGQRDVRGVMVQRFVKISDSQTDSLKDVDINNIILNHSESKEVYKIIGIKDGYFLIDKLN